MGEITNDTWEIAMAGLYSIHRNGVTHMTTQEKHPELAIVADEIADIVITIINRRIRNVESDVPYAYRGQGVMEMVIEKLESYV